MGQVLTLEEIQSRFDTEWDLVEDPELNDALEVVRGKVVWHSKDRDEATSTLISAALLRFVGYDPAVASDRVEAQGRDAMSKS